MTLSDYIQVNWHVWLAGIITVIIYSSLFKDNRAYRLILVIMIGLGVGYGFLIIWRQTLDALWWQKVTDGYTAIFRGDSRFAMQDISDYSTFLYKLQKAETPADKHIKSLMSQTTQSLINQYNPTIEPDEALKTALADELNKICKLPTLYNKTMFNSGILTSNTMLLAAGTVKMSDPSSINRLVLQETYSEIIKPEPVKANLLWILLAIPGLFWYFQFSRKYVWLSRITIGMVLGAGAGIVFKQQLLGNWPQILDSCRPFLAQANGSAFPIFGDKSGMVFSIWQSLNNVIFVLVIICVMIYFFFSFEHNKRTVKLSANAGRWMLMVSFGAFFGNTVMTRMAVFLERLDFLINTWLPSFIKFW